MPLKRYVWDGRSWLGYNNVTDITPAVSQSETAVARATVTATSAAAANDLPTGPGYVRYEDLFAAAQAKGIADPDLQQVFDQLNVAAIVTMPVGVFDTKRRWGKAPYEPDPTAPIPAGQTIARVAAPATDYAFRVPNICKGIWGSGRGTLGSNVNATVIRLTPNTCVSSSEGGSWFQGGGSTTTTFLLNNVQIRGTDQGLQKEDGGQAGIDGVSPKLFTNLFFYKYQGVVTMNDVLSTGWYANNGAPPGETFGIQLYFCNYHRLNRVEVDGRRTVGGLSFGGAGMTAGNCIGAEWRNCRSTHINAKTAGMVFFQSVNCKTFDCEIGDPTDGDGNGQFGVNGGGFNHERVTGSEHYRLKIYKNPHASPGFSGTPDKGTHFNHCGDNWSGTFDGKTYSTADGTMKIVDSTWYNMWNYTMSAANSPTGSSYANPAFIATWIPYGGNANAMTISPEVIQNGVQQPMHWIYGGTSLNVIGPYQA